MDLQIQVQVEGKNEYIELFGTEVITMDVAFAEIQDLTKKNSTFTKSFNVPGSKNNNYIFNYYFDFNSVPLNWIPTRKFEAQIIYDGYMILQGYIRLNNVIIDKTEKTYNITFYNGVGDVAANIGDKFMRDLDLTDLNHPMSTDVYLQSQLDPNLFPLTGTTNYSYQNGKTFWGIYNLGYLYTTDHNSLKSFYVSSSNTNFTIEGGAKTITITPASTPWSIGDRIRLTNTTNRWIEGVVDSYNRNTGSMTFTPDLGLGTGTYNTWTATLVIPEGTPINDIYFSPYLLWSGNTPGFFSFSGTPLPEVYLKPSIQVKELYEQIFNQAGYFVESDFFQTSYFQKVYLPLKFSDDIYTFQAVKPCYTYTAGTANLSSGLIPATATTCNNYGWTADTFGFTIPSGYTGLYTFNINFDYCTTNDSNISGNPNVRLELFIDGVFQTIIEEDYRPAGCWNIDIDFQYNIPRDVSTDIGIFVSYTDSTGYTYTFSIKDGPKFNPSSFDYALEFPEKEFKQIDFITSVNKMFNLVAVQHPTKQKTIIVEPVVDYVGKGSTIDWSSKIDFDSPIQINPTTDLINGTLNYNFKLDKDNSNETFNTINNRIFGTDEIKLNQDYKDEKIDFNLIFASPIDITMNSDFVPYTTVSSYFTIKQETNKDISIQKILPYKALPKLIFRGLVLPADNYYNGSGQTMADKYYIGSNPIDRWQELQRYTTYPFYFSGFSHYLNYRSEDFVDAAETTFPQANDLYNIYYQDYIEDLISTENKIISAKIYLTPWEISNLRFDEKIIIKNNYYRINKITGFNLTEPSLCNIELVKLTRDYEEHPVKYFDLLNCNTGGTDYHTTSDLNYNLYAYVGNYVNIFTGSTTAYTSIGCFEVVEGTFNDQYTYEPIFIGSGYTASNVGVYSDCGCSGATAFNIVQQI